MMQQLDRQRRSRGRPRRSRTIEGVRGKVEGLRGELKVLLEKQVFGTATVPSMNEREILRVSRALRREELLLQDMLAADQTERMF